MRRNFLNFLLFCAAAIAPAKAPLALRARFVVGEITHIAVRKETVHFSELHRTAEWNVAEVSVDHAETFATEHCPEKLVLEMPSNSLSRTSADWPESSLNERFV